MIKNVFWDLDECLIHTSVNSDPLQTCLMFALDDDLNNYYTIVRPCAASIIAYSRSLVGHDNVYILTTSTLDYASEIARQAGWNFAADHILTRETMKYHSVQNAYGGEYTLTPHIAAHKNNVLIDNMTPQYNIDKMQLVGINASRYCHIKDYYGVNHPGSTFEEDVKEFLNTLHNEEY